MIGYKDMTFCNHWRDCGKANECDRPLTNAVAAAARKWWGKDGAPILVFVEKPECHISKDHSA
jgi:hypothetical protein